MVKLFQCIGSRLTYLTLALPWTHEEVLSPAYSPTTPSSLLGISNAILPLCPRLQVLDVHDLRFEATALKHLYSLTRLGVSLYNLTDFEPAFAQVSLPSLKRLLILACPPGQGLREDFANFAANTMIQRGLEPLYSVRSPFVWYALGSLWSLKRSLPDQIVKA